MRAFPLSDHLQPSRAVSTRDEMVFPGAEEQYFTIGQQALKLITLAGQLCNRPSYQRILDLPCGHGRVMRWLRAAWPAAEITGCDLNLDGVQFCRDQFGAVPLPSQPDLRALSPDGSFDLVWCGSLLTHLPVATALRTLDCLLDWACDDGVVIFTTQGRFLSTQLARGEGDYADNVDVVSLLHEYSATGASFQPYYEDPAGHYGLTLMSPEFLQRHLQRRNDVIVRAYLEQAWGVQDVTIAYRKQGFFASLLR